MKDNMKYFKHILFLLFLNMPLLASFSADVVDKKTFIPIENALICDSKHCVKSDNNGAFNINTKEKNLHIKAYGYKRFNFSSSSEDTVMEIEPIIVKALYLSFWRASNNSPILKQILNIIEKSNVNAIVVDVKNEYGSTSYLTSVKQANKYGAHKKRTNRDIKGFMKLMKDKNIYTIARIVTFKDELQASNNPDYAIKNKDGEIWRNHDGMAWVDPFDKRSHKYTIDIAEDAAKVGFDEINFDYIRFPAKTELQFSKVNNEKNRLRAIESFLHSAKNRLRKYGVFISVDTYGNICWVKGDIGIGQKINSLSKYADYISPMLYPSGFSNGSFNFNDPVKHPYEVIYRSVKNASKIIDSSRIRPWLQYFRDYGPLKKSYKKFEVNEQIRATQDINTSGWMMWSPSSRYHLNYFQEQE